ncbi:RHS repeat-associated core domain-containing protein [Luteibacter jiangsuensis]
MSNRIARIATAAIVLFLSSWSAAQSTKHVTYYYTDPQGTVLATTDASGTVTSSSDFTPFGSSAEGGEPSGPSFATHFSDQETGLLYMQARYFDPVIGRFYSVDPVGPNAGGIDSFGRFTYANDNPFVFVDPDGRQNMYALGANVTKGIMLQSSDPRAASDVAQVDAGQARVVATAAAAAIGSPAAGFVARTAVTVAADSIASGSLVTAIVGNASEITASGLIVADSAAAANGAVTPLGAEMSAVGAELQLSAGQGSNLRRFESKLPAGNTGTFVDKLGKDVVFTSTVPGKVPGSSAVYQKVVNPSGTTTGYLKTTFAPDGDVIHVKDKLQ